MKNLQKPWNLYTAQKVLYNVKRFFRLFKYPSHKEKKVPSRKWFFNPPFETFIFISACLFIHMITIFKSVENE